jgi:hypothetical protein
MPGLMQTMVIPAIGRAEGQGRPGNENASLRAGKTNEFPGKRLGYFDGTKSQVLV